MDLVEVKDLNRKPRLSMDCRCHKSCKLKDLGKIPNLIPNSNGNDPFSGKKNRINPSLGQNSYAVRYIPRRLMLSTTKEK